MLQIPKEHCEYFFFALKRSGSHAVINWILQHFDSYIHYNNCFFKNNYFYVNDQTAITKKGTEPYQVSILSFEDKPTELERKFSSDFKNIQKNVKPNKKNILLLRDAYNTYSSRYMKKLNPSKEMLWWNNIWNNYNDINIWISHAEEYLNPNYLGNNLIKINYNDWFYKKEYRKKISAEFQREHTDKGLETVLCNGGGSSFDKLNYDRNAQKMKVLERYQEFITDKKFIYEIIFNKKVKKLNLEIFNFYINFINLFL